MEQTQVGTKGMKVSKCIFKNLIKYIDYKVVN